MGSYKPISTRKLNNFEELNDAIYGSSRLVVQIGLGRVDGHITHMKIHDLPINIGAFTVGMRSRGIMSNDRITIGMLIDRSDKVVHLSKETYPGDVLVTPPKAEHDGCYSGAASFVAISLTPEDIVSTFSGEPRLRDPGTWQNNHFRAPPFFQEILRPQLQQILASLQNSHSPLTDETAEFWKRSIIEAMTAAIALNVPPGRDSFPPPALSLVRKVEDYLEHAGTAPIHISEISSKLHVSRRTLHRAFHDVLGMGPITYLRRRQLCSIHTALLECDPASTTIAEIAMQYGFLNLGRFAGYYRALFGENPSETLAASARRL